MNRKNQNQLKMAQKAQIRLEKTISSKIKRFDSQLSPQLQVFRHISVSISALNSKSSKVQEKIMKMNFQKEDRYSLPLDRLYPEQFSIWQPRWDCLILIALLLVDIKHLIFKSKHMLPISNGQFQGCYWVPNPQTTYLPFFFVNNGNFFTSSFTPQSLYGDSFLPSNSHQVNRNTSPRGSDTNQSQGNATTETERGIVRPQCNIIKEKIIKKPANRPATYLTERKYYLAQNLAEEESHSRKLRPRLSKKRRVRSEQPKNQNNGEYKQQTHSPLQTRQENVEEKESHSSFEEKKLCCSIHIETDGRQTSLVADSKRSPHLENENEEVMQ